jgi:Co/Zn/Cd efflux system component
MSGGADNKSYEENLIITSSGRHGSFTFCKHGKNAQNCCQLQAVEESTDSLRMKQTGDWSHCHSPDQASSRIDNVAKRKLIIACVLCLLFMAAEVVGGFLSGSLAIATDAAHLLTDLASFLISLFSIWLASRPPSKKYNYGWYRAEVVGALTSVLMIWVITGILVYIAIQRLINKDYGVEQTIMLISAGIGVLINLV